jgi:hypothetical protein
LRSQRTNCNPRRPSDLLFASLWTENAGAFHDGVPLDERR